MTVLQLADHDGFTSRRETVLDHEADHRIANNLGLITSLLRLRARAVMQGAGKMEREEVRGLIEDIAARVETVAKLHRMLSQSYRNTQVDLGGYLRELAASLTQSLSGPVPVEVRHHAADGCVLAPEKVLTLGMLVTELITNSVKYAHPGGLPVTIDIQCRRTGTGAIVIAIEDDGVRFPENFDVAGDGGLGLRMVRSLAAQLGGTIEFTSDALGVSACLTLPAGFDGAAN